MSETTHACPPGDAMFTPCCGRTPFELPRTDRMTLDPKAVTCQRAAMEGAARILVAVKEVAPAIRERALALAIDAWCKTNGTLAASTTAGRDTATARKENPDGFD